MLMASFQAHASSLSIMPFFHGSKDRSVPYLNESNVALPSIRRMRADALAFVRSIRRTGVVLIAIGAVCFGIAANIAATPLGQDWRAIGILEPQLSPDGMNIVGAFQGDIWRLPRNGGIMRRLTATASWDTSPTWSPDGKRIAFLSDFQPSIIDAESGSIILSPVASSDATGATEGSLKPIYGTGTLQFDQTGRRLLGFFGTTLESGSVRLSWFDPESRQIEPVHLKPEVNVNWFSLSPDGANILLSSNRDLIGEQGGSDGPKTDLWLVPAKGGEAHKVGEFPTRIYCGAWQGGKLIAATDFGGAHQDLWEIPVNNPAVPARKLTFGQADETAPSVAGGWLVYTDNQEGATALKLRALQTGEEETIRVTGLDFGRPIGRLHLRFVDKDTRREIAARVSLEDKTGARYAPPGSLYRGVDFRLEFVSNGISEIAVPTGGYLLRAHHGPDFKAAETAVEVNAGKDTTVTVEIERWTDPAARGFYSGETHIHANYSSGVWYTTPENVVPLIEAEDLNVANFMVANSDSDGVFDREFFRGEPDPHSTPLHVLYWNEEFRATLWGHMTLLNLKHLVEPIFTGFLDTTNPWDIPTNAEIADHTHRQGGHVDYTHPAFDVKDLYIAAYAARELPVDVALGKIDSMGIINNGPDTYTPCVELWYRLLNCGFRLPPSAGTDTFVNQIWGGLPGSSRSYVKIDGDFGYAAWIKGLQSGRSFVSNGPQLEFESGREIILERPERRKFMARVTSPVPIDRFELIYNGEAIANGVLAPDGLSSTIEQEVQLGRSGWLAVRAFAGDLQAHAAPIYVKIAGRPAGSRADAEYFLKWIDRLEAQLRERDRFPVATAKNQADLDLRAQVASQLESARAVYRQIAVRSD